MHTHIHFSIPFIQQRAGSQTTAIYLCCMNDMLRAYSKQRAIVILPEQLEPVHRAKHTSYVNRNHISLDCLGLLPHLLFRCWQGKWLGPVGLSMKVRAVTWCWRLRSPGGSKSFLFRWRDRTLQEKKVRGSHSVWLLAETFKNKLKKKLKWSKPEKKKKLVTFRNKKQWFTREPLIILHVTHNIHDLLRP